MIWLRLFGVLTLHLVLVSIGVSQEWQIVSPQSGKVGDAAWVNNRRAIEERFLREKHSNLSMSLQGRKGASANETFSIIGRWAWGPCTTVEIAGHYALVGQGFVYQVFDISSPGTPTLVYDTTLSEPIYHIELTDSILFVVLSGEVLFCDPSSYFPLVERGRLNPTVGFLRDMAVSDTLLFLIADGAGLLAFSIADLSRPYFLLQYAVVSQYGVGSIASKGPYVYYGPRGPTEILHILKYVKDSTFFRTSGTSVGGPALAAKVYDTLLVVGSGLGDVSVFSIADPWNPLLLGIVSTQSPIGAIARKDNRLYCSTQDSGLVVVDISVPANPRITAKHQSPNSAAGSLAVQDSILAASGTGLKLYSISSPDQLQDRFYYPTGGYPSSIKMRGNIGFISSGPAGLWSVDFSDPARPRPVQNLRVGYAGPLALTRNLACYLVGPTALIPAQLIVANANDSGLLSFLSATDLGISEIQSIAATDSMAFVGFTDSVVAFKLTNPLSPQRLWNWSLHNVASNQLSVEGDYLYIAQPNGYDNGGLRILNVANYDTPQVVSSLLRNVRGVCVSDSLAVAIADTGLCVLDVSIPANAAMIGIAPVAGSIPIARDGRFTFINANGTVDVFDLSSPNHPTFVGSDAGIQTGDVDCMEAQGKHLFVGSVFTGVWILQNNLVTDIPAIPRQPLGVCQLYQNYPNPFNPTTTIKYSTPTSGAVSLRVYDVLGRQVADLGVASKQPGTYSVQWTVGNLASGVYFYRLNKGELTITKKLIVIK